MYIYLKSFFFQLKLLDVNTFGNWVFIFFQRVYLQPKSHKRRWRLECWEKNMVLIPKTFLAIEKYLNKHGKTRHVWTPQTKSITNTMKIPHTVCEVRRITITETNAVCSPQTDKTVHLETSAQYVNNKIIILTGNPIGPGSPLDPFSPWKTIIDYLTVQPRARFYFSNV